MPTRCRWLPGPRFSIDDAPVVVFEPDSGTRDAVFTARLSVPSTQIVTVKWTALSGNSSQPLDNAQLGVDFLNPGTGTITFQPGETTHFFTVKVIGDAFDENNETFLVNLSAPSAGKCAKYRARAAESSSTTKASSRHRPPSIQVPASQRPITWARVFSSAAAGLAKPGACLGRSNAQTMPSAFPGGDGRVRGSAYRSSSCTICWARAGYDGRSLPFYYNFQPFFLVPTRSAIRYSTSLADAVQKQLRVRESLLVLPSYYAWACRCSRERARRASQSPRARLVGSSIPTSTSLRAPAAPVGRCSAAALPSSIRAKLWQRCPGQLVLP